MPDYTGATFRSSEHLPLLALKETRKRHSCNRQKAFQEHKVGLKNATSEEGSPWKDFERKQSGETLRCVCVCVCVTLHGLACYGVWWCGVVWCDVCSFLTGWQAGKRDNSEPVCLQFSQPPPPPPPPPHSRQTHPALQKTTMLHPGI